MVVKVADAVPGRKFRERPQVMPSIRQDRFQIWWYRTVSYHDGMGKEFWRAMIVAFDRLELSVSGISKNSCFPHLG